MAAPAQLGAPAVPIAWTAEAAALAWLAVRRAHPHALLASLVLYGLAGIAVVDLYVPARRLSDGLPFADGPGAALGFFLLGVAAGLWLLRDRSLRSAVAAFALLIATACAAARLEDAPLVVALGILMVVGAGALRILPRLPQDPIPWQVDGLVPVAFRDLTELRPWVDRVLFGAAAAVGFLAVVILVDQVYGQPFATEPSGLPFADTAGASAILLAGAAPSPASCTATRWFAVAASSPAPGRSRTRASSNSTRGWSRSSGSRSAAR